MTNTTNPCFARTPAARLALCDAALMRWLPPNFDSGLMYDQPQPAPVEAQTDIIGRMVKIISRMRNTNGRTGKVIQQHVNGDYEVEFDWSDNSSYSAPFSRAELQLIDEPPAPTDLRIGSSIHLPYFGLVTIAARVTRFGKDWYQLETTMIDKMVLHKLVGAI